MPISKRTPGIFPLFLMVFGLMISSAGFADYIENTVETTEGGEDAAPAIQVAARDRCMVLHSDRGLSFFCPGSHQRYMTITLCGQDPMCSGSRDDY